MNIYADKTRKNKSQGFAKSLSKLNSNAASAFQFQDNRPEAIAQRKMQEAIDNSPEVRHLKTYQEMADSYSSQTTQRKENKTGLPDNLKSGIEQLSGVSMDDVKVHYNSDKPDRLQALAYAQGTNIHLASGQEKHLPHEAWHIVQQKQGRVKPTLQMKEGVNVNDEVGLEKEADVMGAKALQLMTGAAGAFHPKSNLKQQKITEKQPAQRLMKKLGVTKEEYKKLTYSTVFLYAEFNGKPIGTFKTQKGGHAEENLIEYLIKQGLTDGNLVVYLSTSPCSSVFCTREDGKEGCQERLEKLKSDRNIKVTVHADHLYLKQDIRSQEASFGAQGFSSYSSASTSSFPMTFSSLPKKLSTPEMMDDFDESVAQLQKKLQNIK